MHAFYRGEADPDTSKFFSKVMCLLMESDQSLN